MNFYTRPTSKLNYLYLILNTSIIDVSINDIRLANITGKEFIKKP